MSAKPISAAWCVAMAVMFAMTGGTASAQQSLGDLSGPWQLFVDDYLVATKSGLTRTYHPFQKHAGNPVLIADQPWEGTIVYIYGTVLPNEARNGWRMWYHTARVGSDEGSNILYATSTDGIHWTKPLLGLRSWNGSTANNMFFQRPYADGITSVIHTPWDADPARRYRLMNYEPPGYFGAWSPDGIHVTDVPNNPVFTQAGDVGQFLWDPRTRQYLGYVKVNVDVRGLRRRAVARIATDDIQTWPSPQLVLAPDDFDDRWVADAVQRTHFYGLSAFAYESMYIGLLWIFRATDAEGYYIGPVYTEIVTSRDGIHWLREQGNRPPMLPLGPAGTWEDGQLYTATHPVLENGTLKIYYGACDDVHGTALKKLRCGIGLATLRKDGFASLDAGAAPGQVTTRRLVGAAGPLHVNYSAVGGWLRVEVLDGNGDVVPGYALADCTPLQGDSLDQVVTWGPETELPSGPAALRLRFHLQNASVYSFCAGDAVQVLDDPQPGLACLYTFEKDSGTSVRDKLAADGSQIATLRGAVAVDTNPAHAAQGTCSAAFGCDGSTLNTVEIAGTANLGTRFTLAASVNLLPGRLTRLFSTCAGTGAFSSSEIVFDCDPGGAAVPGLRLACKGIVIQSPPATFTTREYHHLGVTYDDGEVRFYLDGSEVGHDYLSGGEPVVLSRNLSFGDDPVPSGDKRLIGQADDVLVLGRALTGAEVAALARNGAAAFFGLTDASADLDGDGDVDLADFSAFQTCFNGPNRAPACPADPVPARCSLVCGTAAASLLAATPISFAEKWDTYALGTTDAGYVARWAEIAGASRYEVQNTDPVYSATKSLKVVKLAGLGITHSLNPELQAAIPGATEVRGTDANPLALLYYVWMNTDGTIDKLSRADLFVELSKGDVRAPAANSPTVLPVLAFGMTAGMHGLSTHPRFFDGRNWQTVNPVTAGVNWNFLDMKIRTADVVLEGRQGAAGSATYTRAWTGGFDRITIRTVANDGQRRGLDDVYLSGGEVSVPCANPPTATSIVPNTAHNDEVIGPATIQGTNFVAGQTRVALSRPGCSDIVGTNVIVAPDGNSLTCNLDFNWISAGTWNVVVSTTPNCPSATLPGGFTVTEPATYVAADFDHDGDVDLADFAAFSAAFNGPNRPAAGP